MKLYYSPGACSLAPHIVLREVGAEFEAVHADIRAKTLPNGSSYLDVNPKGVVPALGLDDGQVLTENASILQYISDMNPAAGLIPADGVPRYAVISWLSYVGGEVHKSYGPLWNPSSSEDAKQAARDLLAKKYAFVESQLGEQAYLTGDAFTPADAYLFVMLTWTDKFDIPLSPALAAYRDRIAARPAVRAAIAAEGAAK